MKSSRKPTRVFLLVATPLLILVIALVWAMVLRESERRSIVLEYQAFQVSATLVEELRGNPAYAPADQRIIGYGLYSYAGLPMRRSGSAPETLAGSPAPAYQSPGSGRGNLPGGISVERRNGGASVVLHRLLGQPGMPGATGGRQGSGAMRGMGRQMMNPSAAADQHGNARTGTGAGAPGTPPPQSGSAAPAGSAAGPSTPAAADIFSQADPYQFWLEYGSQGIFRDGFLTFGVAIAVTVALSGLFSALILLFLRNEGLRERELASRELVQLGEAARTLVHEIKNPLGVMRIQTARIRRAVATDAAGHAGAPSADSAQAAAGTPGQGSGITASARIIEGEITRLAGLADRIREFLKSGEGNPVEVDLKSFLDGYVRRYSDARDGDGKIVLETGARDGEAIARIDPDRLILALDNLVRNGFEAMSGTSADTRAPGGGIRVRLEARGRTWDISVIDSGSGVSDEAEKRMFEPFFTTKESGSGIGLALSRRIAEAAGGSLGHSRDPGGGAVFTISLPSPRRD